MVKKMGRKLDVNWAIAFNPDLATAGVTRNSVLSSGRAATSTFFSISFNNPVQRTLRKDSLSFNNVPSVRAIVLKF